MTLADWDARLLSPERALHMAGDWPVYATFDISLLSEYGDQPDRWQINLRCRKCKQSCGLLSQGEDRADMTAAQTSIGDLLSGVLRHMVTAHDWSLSGGPQPQREPGPPEVISWSEGHARLIDAITKENEHGQ